LPPKPKDPEKMRHNERLKSKKIKKFRKMKSNVFGRRNKYEEERMERMSKNEER
jgi:hypothetical protein